MALGLITGYYLRDRHIPGRMVAAARGIPIQNNAAALPSWNALPGPSAPLNILTRRLKYGSTGEADSKYTEQIQTLNPEKIALMVIDVWDNELPERFLLHARQYVVPLVQWARQNGLAVFHAPNGRPVASFLEARNGPRELILESVDNNVLAGWLKKQGITTLLYAGYSANGCLLQRSTGMLAMRKRGFEIVLVRDATLAYETPQSLPQEWARHVVNAMVEGFIGSTTLLSSLQIATETAAVTTEEIAVDSPPES